MTTENNRKTRLQKLKGSDFEIMDGQPDIYGWDVLDSSGKQLGEVDELIFDYESRKVRYLVVDLDDNEYDLDDRKVLVPIGIAELHEKDDDVILANVTVDQMRSLPEYDEDRFDTEYENNIRNVFGGLGAATSAEEIRDQDDFYDHEHFKDENLYRNRKGSIEKNASSLGGLTGDYPVASDDSARGGMSLRSRIKEEGSSPADLLKNMDDQREFDESGNRKEPNRDFD